MSDKEAIIELIRQMPDDATSKAILEFLERRVEKDDWTTEELTDEEWRQFIAHSLRDELADPREDIYTEGFCRSRRHLVTQSLPRIQCDDALKIARVDAGKAYRDLSPFRIEMSLEADGWHIDFELKNARVHGGGPHYVIDAQTGVIVIKRYEQ